MIDSQCKYNTKQGSPFLFMNCKKKAGQLWADGNHLTVNVTSFVFYCARQQWELLLVMRLVGLEFRLYSYSKKHLRLNFYEVGLPTLHPISPDLFLSLLGPTSVAFSTSCE